MRLEYRSLCGIHFQRSAYLFISKYDGVFNLRRKPLLHPVLITRSSRPFFNGDFGQVQAEHIVALSLVFLELWGAFFWYLKRSNSDSLFLR